MRESETEMLCVLRTHHAGNFHRWYKVIKLILSVIVSFT